MRAACVITAFALLIEGLIPAAAQTPSAPTVNRWVDSHGTVHFTDTLPRKHPATEVGSAQSSPAPKQKAQAAAPARASPKMLLKMHASAQQPAAERLAQAPAAAASAPKKSRPHTVKRWVDSGGTVHFSDKRPRKVPKQQVAKVGSTKSHGPMTKAQAEAQLQKDRDYLSQPPVGLPTVATGSGQPQPQPQPQVAGPPQ